jgi:hypothetical protein
MSAIRLIPGHKKLRFKEGTHLRIYAPEKFVCRMIFFTSTYFLLPMKRI